MVTRGGPAGLLDPIERASVDALRGLQLERLRWTLKHSWENVATFRSKCEAHEIAPPDLRCLEDLARFPFTTKDEMRAAYPFGLFAVPLSRIVRIHASSGTTGKAPVVGYTRRDIDTWAELVERCIRASGGQAGDRIHIAYGYGLFTGGLGAHYGAERLGAMVIPVSGGQTARQVQFICDLEPDILMCTPSYALNIADEFVRQGLNAAACSLRVGILGAEPWSESMRREIEASLGLDALDIYGLSEAIGPGVAGECIESRDGPTIWEDHFYPEIVDPQTGAVLPDGAFGELVLTSLTKEAMPIVRYRTRDLTRLLPGTARTMRRMERITGRCDDMLIIRGVNVFPTQIEECVLKQPGLAPHYQLHVAREGRLDALAVHVERTPGTANGNADRIAQSLQRDIKAYVGVMTRIEVLEPGGVPRSAGKAVRVVDERSG